MNPTMDEGLTYYAQLGPMTDPGGYAGLFKDLPADVAGLVRIVQRLAVHIFWAQRYGLSLPREREAEVSLCPVHEKLARFQHAVGRHFALPECAGQGALRVWHLLHAGSL
jgi:hypothetical protein